MRMFKVALLVSSLLLPAISAAAQEPVTLKYWSAGGGADSMEEQRVQEQIALFEKAHPNIKIDMQHIPYDALHDKLVTAIAAGDAPDLSWGLAEWFGELYRMGALEDLTAAGANWPDKENIYPNVMSSLMVGDKLYAMPHYLGIRALLYHEETLKKAGVAVPKTWAELIEAAIKIKEATGQYGFGIAATGPRSPQEVIMFLAQSGVSIAERQADGKFKNTWNDDPAKLAKAAEVFAFYEDLVDKGAIAPEAASWGYEQEDTNMSLNLYAMGINGPWMRERVAANPETMKDIKIAAPPYNTVPATFFEINPFYVYKSKYPKETWEFVTFLSGKQFQEAVHPDNSPRSDVVSDNQWGRDFMALAPTGIVFPPVSLGQVLRHMEESIGRATLKKEDPTAIAKWLSDAINDDLKQSGELSGS